MALLEQPIDLKTGLPKIDISTMQGANTVKIPDSSIENPYAGFSANALSYVNAANAVPQVETGQIYQQLDARFGNQAAATEARNLKAQIEANAAQAEAARAALSQQASGRDVTSAFLGRQEQAISREETIRNAPLLARYQAAQGDYQAAQDTVNKLYAAQVADETNRYNQRQNAIKVLYEAANESEKSLLDAKIKQDEQAFKAKQEEIAFNRQKEMAKFQQELKGVELTYKELSNGQLVALDKQGNIVKTIGSPEISKEEKEKLAAQDQAVSRLPQLASKVTAIDDLIKDPYLTGAVGANKLARLSPTSAFTGGRDAFIAGVENLISQETLDTLLALKQAGGTLGAISEKELSILQSAASKISQWALVDEDTKKVYGYDVGEKKFIEELNRIKQSTQRVIDASKRINADSEKNPLGIQVGGDPLNLGL